MANDQPVSISAVLAQADMRVVGGECLRWQLGADSEALAWLPATPTAFLASTEDGTVAAFDARNGSGAQHLAWHCDRSLIGDSAQGIVLQTHLRLSTGRQMPYDGLLQALLHVGLSQLYTCL